MLDLAAAAPALLLVEDRPFEERNHAGADGERIYARLRERERAVSPIEVTQAMADGRLPESAPMQSR